MYKLELRGKNLVLLKREKGKWWIEEFFDAEKIRKELESA